MIRQSESLLCVTTAECAISLVCLVKAQMLHYFSVKCAANSQKIVDRDYGYWMSVDLVMNQQVQ